MGVSGVSGLSVAPFGGALELADRIRSANPTAFWPLWDLAGPEAEEVIGSEPNVDFLENGDFETKYGALDWAWWQERAGTGTLVDDTVIFHGGSRSLKLIAGGGADTWLWQQPVAVRPGKTLTISGWTRGDGVSGVGARYALYDDTNGVWIQALTEVGTTTTTWTYWSTTHVLPAGCYAIRIYAACATGVVGSAVWWDDMQLNMDWSLDGIYASAGVTYGEPGIGDGNTSVAVSGANTYCQVGYPGFSSLWDGDLGTAIMWGRVDGAARWTDGSTFRYLWHIKSALTATRYIVFGKHTNNHSIFWRRRNAGGILEIIHNFGTGPTDWFCMAMTWDVSGDNSRMFWQNSGVVTKEYDGVLGVGGGAWGTDPVNDQNAQLLAGSLTAQEWMGWGAMCAWWNNVALGDAAIAALMVV